MPVAEVEAPPTAAPPAPVGDRDDARTGPEVVPGAAHGLPDGARMTRAEYHRLYERTPPGFRAELIGGVVHVRGQESVSISNLHAIYQQWLSAWFYEYVKRTPGVRAYSTPTVQLGENAEPEPDGALLRLRPGEETDSENLPRYVDRPPELTAEVAVSSLATDLGAKFRDYHAAGVAEYVVFDVRGRRVRWFARDADGVFVDLAPGADGCLKSRAFPGLWLDAAAFFAEDAAGLEAAVARGVAARDAADRDAADASPAAAAPN